MILRSPNAVNIKSLKLVDKRLFLSGLLLLTLMVSFWSLSRYPALDLKAAMSDTMGVAGGLSFDSNYDLDSVSNVFEKIAYTLLNWLNINEQGMLFGLALSTVLLVLIPLIVTRLPQGKISAIFSGLMLGIPMGLCVNCAAPIAYGLYQQKTRAEMALVTMLSSPQLNIIVVLMAFSLFPAYLIMIKLLLSLLLILFVVPLVVHIFMDESPQFNQAQTTDDINNQQCEIYAQYSWRQAFVWLLKSLFSQGMWLLIKVLPLMLVAGVIGATLITLLPWQQVIELMPASDTRYFLFAVIALAAFGLLLPVPITFDIILAAVLFANDVPIVYIAVLLFTLGSFSIYSWFILVKAGAIKTASALAFSILVLGVIAGFASDFVEQHYIEQDSIAAFAQLKQAQFKHLPLTNSSVLATVSTRQTAVTKNQRYKQSTQSKKQQIKALKVKALMENREHHSRREFDDLGQLTNIKQTRVVPARISNNNQNSTYTSNTTIAKTVKWHSWPGNNNIDYVDFSNRSADVSNPLNAIEKPLQFNYVNDNEMGFKYHQKPLYEQFVVPFIQMNSLTSGDFNNDGWIDVAVGTYTGVYLYENIGGTFQLASQNTAFAFDANIVGAVALQDMNNDGWLDLIWSSDKLGGFVAYNKQGEFKKIVALPIDKRIAFAVAFDDVNNDGMLDILWGQYFNEWLYNEENHNVLLIQENDQFIAEQLPGPPGSALTALFSDINGDGNRELMIGNEFDQADIHYRSVLTADHQSWNDYWPAVPHSTMSITSADINNDLLFESYHAQITHNPSGGELRVPLIKKQDYYDQQCQDNNKQNCLELQQRVQTMQAKRHKMAGGCLAIAGDARYECLALLLTKPNLRDSYEPVQVKERIELCALLTAYSLELQLHCLHKLNIIAERKALEHDQLTARAQETAAGQQVEVSQSTEAENYIKQVGRYNMLYQHTKIDNNINTTARQAIDVAKEYGIDITGWAWNAKFADLDGDSWQDLFVVNGYSEQQAMTSNAWYQNIEGNRFTEKAAAVGLDFFEDMLSYLYIDVDNDGDLDIIGFDIQGHLHTWINNENMHNHLQIELRDAVNNINGIGAKIVIRYGENNKLHQIREIKASGGFLSMDSAIMHFGVKNAEQVSLIEVIDSKSVRHTFKGPFETNRRYRINLNSLMN